MSTLKSVASLANTIKTPIDISRKSLRKSNLKILTRIVGPVLTVTLFAIGIATAFAYGYNVTLTNSVTPLLAVVVGLILVFRNTTSYDRYYEGRKDFGSMMSTIRNLSRLIWINVNATDPNTVAPSSSTSSSMFFGARHSATDDKTLPSSENLKQQKIRALKLLLSYAFAVKHHLRGEDGTDWPDYKDVLPSSFARFDQIGYDHTANGSYSSIAVGNKDGSVGKKGSRRSKVWSSSQAVVTDATTPLLTDSHQTVEFHPYAADLCLPLPMVIAHEVTRMLYKFKRLGYLDVIGPAGTNAMMQLCGSLSDQLTAMERIANTPIPTFYGVHLKQCVTLYLFALPFTLVKDLGWKMVPVVTVVAVTLMGIEGIADEIEMPFGNDACDLPLDLYCAELKNEIEYVIARLPQGIEDDDPFAE
ncbi:hypothetical protein K439DRAFT_1654555 [Ramaria rubella]|nr:hypothetical protein K439DRAFT_1654555 [Ramaria rubella]